MAFKGHKLDRCFLPQHFSIDRTQVFITYVPGNALNGCGHVLLKVKIKVGQINGFHYFHIPGFELGLGSGFSGIYDHPHFFHESLFEKYLTEHEKDKSKVKHFKMNGVTDEGAKNMSNKLQLLMEKPYLWLASHHNCQSFVEEVLKNSGANFQDQTGSADCPAVDFGQKPSAFIKFIFLKDHPWRPSF